MQKKFENKVPEVGSLTIHQVKGKLLGYPGGAFGGGYQPKSPDLIVEYHTKEGLRTEKFGAKKNARLSPNWSKKLLLKIDEVFSDVVFKVVETEASEERKEPIG